ncbi:MAG: arylsulfatase A-like enzyme [Pseudohongiellaceae bacterium]|jgi:arylsulfatase A-like enzyme
MTRPRRSHLSPVRAAACIALTALCFASCGESQTAEPETARAEPPLQETARNVILLVVDTLRADRLGCYGYPRNTSPNIDAWAAGGTLYEDNRGQGSWTRPAMISMMSGSYITTLEEQLPPELPTLAELVQGAGKTTAAMVGNKILVGERGFPRGFDTFEAPKSNGNARPMLRQFYKWYDRQEEPLKDGPGFFAWLHVMDPHAPREPAKRFRDELKGNDPETAELMQLWNTLKDDVESPPAGGMTFDEATAKMLDDRAAYDAEVRAMDDCFGQLIAFLRRRGELEQTLIILTSDHGEELYQQPRVAQELRRMRRLVTLKRDVMDLVSFGHSLTFQEEVWHIPLIFAGPGFPAGTTREGLAANLDIFPTVLQALGIAAPPATPGQSLLGGVAPQRKQVFGFTHGMVAVKDSSGLKLVDRTDWRDYTRFEPVDRDDEADGSPLELYDLNVPHGDGNNVAADHEREVEYLSAGIAKWRKQYQRAVTDTELGQADLDALRELGYVGDDH